MRIRFQSLMGAALLSMGVLTAAQSPIQVGASVQVSKALAQDPHYEIEIGANPNNAKELIACSMVFPPEAPTSQVDTFVTFDGGRTWQLSLRQKAQLEAWDPACEYGPGGVAYSLSEAQTRQYPDGYDRLDRSLDGGKTWLPFTRMIHAERSFLTVDNQPGPHHGWLFVYGMNGDHDIRVSYSRDGGTTFVTQIVPVQADAEVVNVGPGDLLSDGSLVIPVPTVAPPGSQRQDERVWRPGFINVVRMHFQRPNWPLKSQVDRVTRWWVDLAANGSYYTTLAIDHTHGPFRDRIYAVWEDWDSGRSRVRLTYSSDLGKTWSAPRNLDDNLARRDGDHLNGPDDIHGTVAVNDRGVVGVMWLDRRDQPDNLGWAVRFRASRDGGDTFVPGVKASTADYDPSRGGRVPLFNDLALPWFAFHGGHTMGLAADAAGAFHPLWVANPEGVAQVWTTTIRVDGDAVRHGSPALANLVDVSGQVKLQFLERFYNLKTHTVSFAVRVLNTSQNVIHGPLKVRVLYAGSYMGRVEVSDNGAMRPLEGTIWEFKLPGGALQPGAMTAAQPVVLYEHGLDPFTQIGHFPMAITPLADLRTTVLAGAIRAAGH
ncbi:MAG: exo-alpha-sialidase [Acidobacteria bacterium]|nr:MAG: exo-alpha-sialidase [Acidobacteriota bacterium]